MQCFQEFTLFFSYNTSVIVVNEAGPRFTIGTFILPRTYVVAVASCSSTKSAATCGVATAFTVARLQTKNPLPPIIKANLSSPKTNLVFSFFLQQPHLSRWPSKYSYLRFNTGLLWMFRIRQTSPCPRAQKGFRRARVCAN